MAKVIDIFGNDPRPPDSMSALALLEEAQRLLDGLVERGEVEIGTCPDLTRPHLADAIDMLTPFGEKSEKRTAPA